MLLNFVHVKPQTNNLDEFPLKFLLPHQDSLKGGKWSNGAKMTEEEALAEQQRMFAEARARMNGGAAPPKKAEVNPNIES